MRRYCLAAVLIGLLLCTLLLPTRADAGDFLGLLWTRANRPAHVTHGVSPGVPVGTTAPGPHRYSQQNVRCPWYGYGFGVPSYNWGYFGARYRPSCVSHTGYYGDFTQWGYRRGY